MFDMEGFNLKELNNGEGREQRESRLLQNNQLKSWFNAGCSKLLDERKQAKLQYLQDPSKINGYNLNNV
jgi:hypothetical protein